MQRFLKPLVFCLCLSPTAYLVFNAVTNRLGANPIKAITHFTGDWTLYFLLITLAITPLRRITGYTAPLRYRRMLGLYAFYYACLHFLTYLVLDQFFDWGAIAKDIVKRPYITVGFAAFVLLIPLAATSNTRMMQKLGRKWRPLHRLVYTICGLGILHYLWLVKADIRAPVMFGIIFIALMLLRLPRVRLQQNAKIMRSSS